MLSHNDSLFINCQDTNWLTLVGSSLGGFSDKHFEWELELFFLWENLD